MAADSSPTALQARATALGMVPTTMTKVHRRPDGRALAVQTPVYVPPPAAGHDQGAQAGEDDGQDDCQDDSVRRPATTGKSRDHKGHYVAGDGRASDVAEAPQERAPEPVSLPVVRRGSAVASRSHGRLGK